MSRGTAGPSIFPPIVGDVLRSPGQPLTSGVRALLEPRFGHDFGHVRVHTDEAAARSARAMQASAFTVGNEIIFGAGKYRPGTMEGRRLLAHELTHVVQQASTPTYSKAVSAPGDPSEREAERVTSVVSVGRAVSIRPMAGTAALQRNGDLTLSMPQLGASRREHGLFPPRQESQLRLDPWVQAYSLLDPDMIQRALLNLELGSLAAPPPSAVQIPATPPATPAPVVPQGAGPATPRAGSASDILGAFVAVPAVRAGINRLRDMASDRLRHDWRSLSTGERVVVIGATALVAGGALAGILSNDASRQFALQQIQGRAIPIPLVPGLSVQVNPIGPNQSVMLNLDLSALARRLGM